MAGGNQDAINRAASDQLKLLVNAMKELTKAIGALDSRTEKLEKAGGSSSSMADAADKRAREVQVALGNLVKRVEALEKKGK